MSSFSNDIPYQTKLHQRKVATRSGKNLTRFCWSFILEFGFYVRNGIQSRICTDLLKFQSKVRDPIHIIILMMSIFHFSFILFMYLHLLINNKNQIIICNISEKTFSDYVYLGKYTQTYAPFNVWFHSWSENN